MNLDELTLGQIKEIRRLLGDSPAPSVAPSLLDAWIGSKVVVRSNQSGVWWGTLRAAQGSAIALSDARRAWHWTGAGSCSGLATTGPGGGKIAGPVDALITDACEILSSSPVADAAWASQPVWSGK